MEIEERTTSFIVFGLTGSGKSTLANAAIGEMNRFKEGEGIESETTVVDGVVGDVIDGTVDGVTDTILDLAGIRNTYENQFSIYDNIEGFSYNVDVDNDNEYKVVYEIDMDKISDNDLATFNVTRGFQDIRTNYEDLGYTCK